MVLQADPAQDDSAQAEPQQQSEPQQNNSAPSAPAQTQSAEKETGVARVSLIHGDVSTQRGDSGDWATAILNAPIVTGDRVSTGDDGRAEVQLDYANILRVDQRTQANITNLTNVTTVTNINYANRNVPSAITAVSGTVFTQSKMVAPSMLKTAASS